MEEISSRSSGIDDLPLEVLSEVVSNLDFIDILPLQQTSRKLRESTETHVVWLALAKKYSDQHFRLSRPETGSFDDLKTDELRAWIRKRLVVDQIWRSRRAQPHFRTIQENVMETAALKLVPGTSWLLVGDKDGSVRCRHLDSGSQWVPLTPSYIIPGGFSQSLHDLEVHLDESASRLEFKLAMHTIVTDSSVEPGLGELHVWQVRLEDHGNSLAAEWLNSIPYGYAVVRSLALGQHLMVCGMSSLHGLSWVEIIWWDQCSEARLLRTRFSFSTGYEQIDKIHLLGDDKILCINPEGVVRLYTLPEPNGYESTSLIRLEHLPSREPIWSYSLSGGMYEYRSSPVNYNGTTYRLAVNVGDLIWGLIFPATEGDDPSVVKLSNVPQHWDMGVIGVRKAYAFRNKDGTGILIGYNWDSGGGNTTIRHFEGKRKDVVPHRRLAFDEEIGRLVYSSIGDIVVVDYFPSFNATP